MRINQPYGQRHEIEAESLIPKRKYFIACEGKRTEYKYFKGMMEARNELLINPLVEIIPINHTPDTNPNPLQIISQAETAIENEGSFRSEDQICIIVDRDKNSFTSRQYNKAMNLCKSKVYRLFVTNPCFELWLLLHYSDLSEYSIPEILENKKIGQRTQVEIYLKDDYLDGSYNKTRIRFNDNYKKRVHAAITNAGLHATTLEDLKSSVGTNVGLLINEMMESPPLNN